MSIEYAGHDRKGSLSVPSGFSLIEVLFSLAILSIGVLGITSASVGTIRANETSENYTIAATLAQDMAEWLSSEAAAGIALTAGSDTPRAGFARAWTIDADTPEAGVSQLGVTISWTDYGPKQITLTTIIND